MFETLVGRLKWERTEHGIRVEYRMRGDYAAIWQFLMAGWRNNWPAALFLAAILFVADLFARHRHTAGWWSARWWADPLAMLVGTTLARLISILAYRSTLTLEPTKLEFEFRRWNWSRGRETYLTAHLHDLRFMESTTGADTRNGLRLSEIQFDNNFATQFFAVGIRPEEASTLIAKMMEVYPFPTNSATIVPAYTSVASNETR